MHSNRKATFSSPLTGEDEGGGEKLLYFHVIISFPLPFIPSSPRRRLYELEAARGGETDVSTYTNSCEARNEFDIEMTRTLLG